MTQQDITDLWHDLRREYAAGDIHIEELTYGQGILYRLTLKTQGLPYAKLWLEEQHRAEEEDPQ